MKRIFLTQNAPRSKIIRSEKIVALLYKSKKCGFDRLNHHSHHHRSISHLAAKRVSHLAAKRVSHLAPNQVSHLAAKRVSHLAAKRVYYLTAKRVFRLDKAFPPLGFFFVGIGVIAVGIFVAVAGVFGSDAVEHEGHIFNVVLFLEPRRKIDHFAFGKV